MDMKKTTALLCVLALFLSLLLAGCTTKYTQEEVDAQVTSAVSTATADFNSQLDASREECTSNMAVLEADMTSVTTALRNAEADRDAILAKVETTTADSDSKVAELEAKIDELTNELNALMAKYQTASDVCAKVENYDLNTDLESTLTDGDLPQLFDGKVEFDGAKYDTHEEIVLSSDVLVSTSEVGDKEFSASPYLVIGDDEAVTYKYVFDDRIDTTLVNSDDSLKITLLGQPIEIVEADSSSIVLVRGQTRLLEEGETTTLDFEGKTAEIVVMTVSDGSESAKFTINGEASKALKVGDSDKVGEFYIYVSEVLPNEAGETAGGDMVEIRVFDDEIRLSIDNDDWVDDEEKLWKYTIVTDGDDLVSVGVYNTEKYYKFDDETPALAVGERFSLPYNYASLGISELENDEYDTVEFSFDDSYGPDDEPVLVIESNNGALLVGTEEVSKVGFTGTRYLYKDDEGEWQEVTSITYENDEYSVSPSFDGSAYTFDEVSMTVDIANSRLGATEEDVDAFDVMVNGVDVSSREFDVLTSKGVKVSNVESNVEDDTVVLDVPSDVVEAKVCFM